MSDIWLQSDLNLQEEFSQGNFSKLLEYAKQNELHLMSLVFNENGEPLAKSLRLSTSLLRYFEETLKQDEKAFTAFKLGALFGHIECLNRIGYEDSSNELALKAFDVAKTHMPFISETKLKGLLFALFSEGSMRKSKLEEHSKSKHKFYDHVLAMELLELDYALTTFEGFGIIHCYSNFEDHLYSITDTGIRIVQQFKREKV